MSDNRAEGKIRQGKLELQLRWTEMSLMRKWQLSKDLKESGE